MPQLGSYLQRSRHGSLFYFRRRVPADLHSCVGQRTLYLTLRTTDRGEAIKRARATAAYTDQLFEALRGDTGDALTKKSEELRMNWLIAFNPLTGLEYRPDEGDTSEDTQVGLAAFAEAAKRIRGDSPEQSVKAAGVTLRQLVDEFLPTLRSSKTVRAYRTAFEHQFLPHFGETTDVQRVDQDAFAAWVKKVFADESRSHSTKLGYVNAVTSMFSWRAATHSKATPTLSTRKLIPPKEEADTDDRDPFEMSELAAVLRHAARYKAEEPYKFWVTTCVAFMGCRIEELAQVDLRVDLRF